MVIGGLVHALAPAGVHFQRSRPAAEAGLEGLVGGVAVGGDDVGHEHVAHFHRREAGEYLAVAVARRERNAIRAGLGVAVGGLGIGAGRAAIAKVPAVGSVRGQQHRRERAVEGREAGVARRGGALRQVQAHILG